MSDDYTLRTIEKISEVSAEDWNACCPNDHPFVSYEFLSALENSGCVNAETGWMQQHLIVEKANQIVAALPLYIKGHSQGEYVFDHSWAHAYERAGGRYYPKIQVSVPFSPVNGPRFLCKPGHDSKVLKSILANGAKQVATKYGLSSVHFTFIEEDDKQSLEENGFVIRTGEQFHWVNNDYSSFDDFLDQLSSRKRKAIKKERKTENFASLDFEILEGDAITSEHWVAFYDFYMDTGSRKWGTPYLNLEFFEEIGETLKDQIVLIMVKQDDLYIAGALNLKSEDCLYGRYWGCIEDHRFLHFEVCYYLAIDYAIQHGIKRVEAGAQGPHKLARGYLPTKTYSAHWMQDPGFHDAIQNYLVAETREMNAELEYLGKLSPFKKS